MFRAANDKQYGSVCGKCGAIRHDAGIGLEPTLAEYLDNMRAVGRELWRVLRDDGTLWLNMGDCYVNHSQPGGGDPTIGRRNIGESEYRPTIVAGLKPKDLVGLPWRVAFAFQEEGWYLRSDIIWAKPNPMPESVRDRPTKAHEYLFLLSKKPRYYYDAEAVREPANSADRPQPTAEMKTIRPNDTSWHDNRYAPGPSGYGVSAAGRNRRTVWTIPTQPYKGAHFATFPPKLVEPCILAGTSPKACGVCGAPWERVVERKKMVVRPGPSREARQENGRLRTQVNGTMVEPPSSETVDWRPTCDHDDDSGKCIVFDPFCGSGTVGEVAQGFGRRFVGLDLSEPYLELARKRIAKAPIGFGLA